MNYEIINLLYERYLDMYERDKDIGIYDDEEEPMSKEEFIDGYIGEHEDDYR